MYINKFAGNDYIVIEKTSVESTYGDKFEDINEVMKTCLPEEIEVVHYYKEPIYDVYINGELRKSNLKEKEMHMYIDLMNLLNKEKSAL